MDRDRENDALAALMGKANGLVAEALASQPPPLREVPEMENAYDAALRACVPAIAGLQVRETQLQVGRELSADFPGLGGVDLTLEQADGPIALIELKLGRDTLWNCAWDLAKLSLCLRHGIAQRAFMIGAAPMESWQRERQGPGLFEAPGEWDTAAFLEQYANCFRLWKSAPHRLPSRLRSRRIDSVKFTNSGVDYLMTIVEVLADGAGWVEIDGDLRASTYSTGGSPTRIDLSSSDEKPSEANRLLALEGGSVYLLNEADVFRNEMAAHSPDPEEDLDVVSLLRFDTPADRREYLRERGWLNLDPGRRGGPAAMRIEVRGMTRDLVLQLEGARLHHRERGEPVASRAPTPEAWQRFFAEVEAADPWSWARRYSPMRMATDGESWSVLLAHDGRLAQSSGYLDYPPARGGVADPFAVLLAAGMDLLAP